MRRRWLWVMGIMTLLAAVVIGLSFFIDEPLRRYVERQVNSRLKGYTVRLAKLDLRLLRFAVDLSDLSIIQDANPEPPVVHLPRLNASLHWRALLAARVVGDVLVERPQLHVNLQQLRTEAADDIPLKDRGWQEAVQSISALKLNRLRVIDGEVTYTDLPSAEPLRISQLNLRAENIRNIRSQAGTYPSTIHLNGVIFTTGQLQLDGRADFLAVPHAAVKAQLVLNDVELGGAKTVASRYHLALQGGTLSATGDLEYTPTLKLAHLRKADIRRLRVDYIHTPKTAAAEREKATQVKQVAKEIGDAPGILIKADEISLVESHIGFVNKATKPDYRLFLTDLEVHLTNFNNRRTEGTMAVKATGKFMGSGRTVVAASFRPETKGPDFTLAASIENTQMQRLNQLLRAYGKFDVVQGLFSVYTELIVKDGTVRGYVKPLFKEIDIYDSRQDREKNLFQKIYEGLVGGVSELLENVPRDEVATKVNIGGRLENPRASIWEILANLLQNAFFRAILPGFEQNVKGSAP